MNDTEKKKELQDYRKFLERLALERSSKRFGNAGIEYASTLMSVLFENTETEASLYCEGFKPELITTEPYWGALNKYLREGTGKIRILVESDQYTEEQPIRLLRTLCADGANNCRDRIKLKHITPEAKSELMSHFLGGDYNFAFFDNDKYRVEYKPKEYKAFGSFNEPDVVKHLRNIYDTAWEASTDLLGNNE